MGKHKFKDQSYRRKYVIACISVIILICFTLMLPFLLNVGSYTDVRGGSDVSTTGQISYILHNPFEYAKTLLYFMADYTSFAQASYYSSFYAYVSIYSHASGPISFCATATLLIVLFCAFTDKGECDDFKKVGWYKLLMVGSAFATLVLIASALYITFTAVGSQTIAGCQWRYIVPSLFPLLYCAGSSKTTNHMGSKKMGAIVFGTIATILAVSFLDVYVLSLQW